MRNAQWWARLGYFAGWIAAILACIAVGGIILIYCKKGKYIEASCSYFMSQIPTNNDYVMVPKAKGFPTDRTYPPIFTLPTFSDTPELQDVIEEDPSTKLAISVITLICMVMIVGIFLLKMYKRCQHKSSIIRTGFPLFPLSRVLRGRYRTDLFLEVTELDSGLTTWTFLKSTAYYPSLLTVTGTPTIQDIQLDQVCCCFLKMSINWQNIQLMDHKNRIIRLPNSAWVSIFTERELDQINHNSAYDIKLFGRVLDQVMEIRKVANGPNANAPPNGAGLEQPPEYNA